MLQEVDMLMDELALSVDVVVFVAYHHITFGDL